MRPKEYTYKYLPVGTKVLLKGGRWDSDSHYGSKPSIIVAPDDKYSYVRVAMHGDLSYIWNTFVEEDNEWPCEVLKYPPGWVDPDMYICFDCRAAFDGDIHYLCPECRSNAT